ncbi:type VII secretion-associated serine protease mycosin [Actinoplanes sp. NPDC051346]|uniref:type VII secretion-associated serine protease mycosin n=1 Tax=Actinoplanes sp. NPDC051346 TaxID=3155048 RepID=UPI00341F45C2
MRARQPRRIAACVAGALSVLLAGTPAVADSMRNRQWHLSALDVATAHRISTGEGVTVAVIDSGVNAKHPDLAGSVLPGIDLTGDRGDGRTDTHGHGTGMAGLIAAHGHGQGGADGALGIAPGAKILPIRDAVGKIGNPTNLPKGIGLAVDRGAKVISISSVAGTFPALKQAIANAVARDVVVVAAVGNRPDDFAVGYPARYPGVIAVGATGRDGNLAKVSITGPEVMLTAPGVDVISTDGPGGYRIGTGTSDSTAIVAGAAALIRSRYPDATADEVIHRLTATATDKGPPGRDPRYGYGTLNLVSALTTANLPAAESPSASASPVAPAPTATASAPPVDTSGPAFRFTTAFYVAIAIAALIVVSAAVLLVWLITRRRRP